MTKLTLNSTEFIISGYNRYTNIDTNGVHSSANVSFPDNSQYSTLTQMPTITSLSIAIDGSTIYTLSNLNAKVTNINENLYDGGVSMNAQIVFNQNLQE